MNRFIPAGAGNSRLYTIQAWQTAVYPRWRGELGKPVFPGAKFIGLSPLARGTRGHRKKYFPRKRFIPAGAGNSKAEEVWTRWRAVYPRWRGELGFSPDTLKLLEGLSPLARGTQ
ncbi:hypothetical protein SEHO0A_02974 [Salmonella enterica subsp. houtenae str. ATCC BAA-1581]|nr:hypothetical protein SEHO0A_02974 [Salmonella enterica subsp. houtenae str. ATCC BAA-1581]